MGQRRLSKAMALILCLCMVLTMSTGLVFAEPSNEGYTDTKGHWAENAIDRWTDEGIVQGNNYLFNPDFQMTRAEAATIFVNLLGLQEMIDLGAYADVSENAWYHDAISKCVAAGIMKGTGYGLDPTGNITREQFFVMLGRAIGIKEDAIANKVAVDKDDISSWAEGMINAMMNKGFIKGMQDGTILPMFPINRASVMSLLDQTIGAYANKEGENIEAGKGITLVVADDVTVTGNADTIVVAGEDIGVRVNATCDNLNLVGKVNSVIIDNQIDSVVVTGEKSKIEALEGAKVENIEVAKTATNTEIVGEGTVAKVDTKADNTKVDTNNTQVEVAAGVTGTTAQGKAIESAPATDADQADQKVTDEQTQTPTKPSGKNKKTHKTTIADVKALLMAYKADKMSLYRSFDQDTIQSIKNNYADQIDAVTTVAEAEVLLEQAKTEIDAIPTISDILKEAIQNLEETLAEGGSNVDLYQFYAVDAATSKAKVEAKVSYLIGSVTVTANTKSFTPAVAGDDSNLDGTEGSYNFTLTLTFQGISETSREVSLKVVPTKKLAAPSGVGFVAEGYDNGKLTGIEAGMAYSLDNGVNWIEIIPETGGYMEISDLPDSDIKVIRAGNGMETTNSAICSVTVSRAVNPLPSAPIATYATVQGESTGMIIGVNTTMEYRIGNDEVWYDVEGGSITDLPAGNVCIRVKASGSTLASEVFTVTIGTTTGTGGQV